MGVIMRTKMLFIIFMIFNTFSCCSQNQNETFDDDLAVKMLKDFYVTYLIAIDDTDYSKIKSVLEKYCSTAFIDWYEASDLGHDPFINAQDTRPDWPETLKITKNPDSKSLFNVTLYDDYYKLKTTISLLVIKEGRVYKIDKILNPSIGEDWEPISE